MRKLAAAAAVLILLSALALTAFAAEGNLKMTDVQANAGDIIQITVSLTEQTQGNAMGITYTYDDSRLEALTEQCVWAKKGVLQDFGSRNRDGVWAVSDPVDLKGDVCVLVFRVLESASFKDTEVSCTLTVKNGDREVGTYQAKASVAKQCSHSFGSWSDSGELGHSRVCSLCSERQTQTHTWDGGTLTQDPNNPGSAIKTSTCTVCSATKTETVVSQLPEVIPTQPTQSTPTQPEETKPTEERPKPTYPDETEETTKPTTPKPTESTKTETTKPTENSDLHGSGSQGGYEPGDYNRPPEETGTESTDPHEHAQADSRENGESAPMVIPIEGWTGDPETEEESIHDHDHDLPQTESRDPSALSAFAALATVVAMAALGWLFYRRKR